MLLINVTRATSIAFSTIVYWEWECRVSMRTCITLLSRENETEGVWETVQKNKYEEKTSRQRKSEWLISCMDLLLAELYLNSRSIAIGFSHFKALMCTLRHIGFLSVYGNALRQIKGQDLKKCWSEDHTESGGWQCSSSSSLLLRTAVFSVLRTCHVH